MTRETYGAWLTAFCRGWEEADTEALVSLFTAHGVFWETPFDPPEAGEAMMRQGWDQLWPLQHERRMDAEILAVTDDTGVARWRGSYRKSADGTLREMDGIFLTRHATDGRCLELIEWRHARDDGTVVPT